MPNELPLPPRVAEIDNEIQTLELLEQGLNGLTGVRNSLDEAINVLDHMSSDLKGTTLTMKDLVKLEADPKTGEPVVKLDTTKIDPLKLDKTALPANLVKEAIRAQKVLEEIVKPLAESQSKLLKAMEKLSSGLDKGSDLFKKVSNGIKNIKRAWDLFDRAMEGEISSGELIEAFDTYFSEMLDVLADAIGKVPGLGAFLAQYAKAIKSIIPDLKKINAATLKKNEAIRNVFTTIPEPTATAPDPQTVLEEQTASVRSQIEALNEERMGLLNSHQAELARLAKLEIDGLWAAAAKSVEHTFGYTFDRISEITFSQMNALWIGWPSRIAYLKANDPTNPEIAELEAKMAKLSPELAESWRTQMEMRAARVEELERLVRQHSHLLQEADLQELLNRFPELEDAVNDIRAGNPQGKVSDETVATVATAVGSTGMSGKAKAGIGVAVGAVVLVGAFVAFSGGGTECPPTVAMGGMTAGIHAADDPCPPEDDAVVSLGDDPVDEPDDDLVAVPPVEPEPIDDEPDEEPVVEDPEPVDLGLILGVPTIASQDLEDVLLQFVDPDGSITPRSAVDDPSGDFIYSIPTVQVTHLVPAADLRQTLNVQVVLTPQIHEDLLGNTVFECGLDDGTMTVVCPEGDPAIADEPLTLVASTVAASIEDAQTDGQAIFAYVVDRDGLPENNWVANPSFAWDYYQGSDTWIEVFYDYATDVWTMSVREIGTDGTIAMSDVAVRAVVVDDSVMFIVPESVVPLDARWRVSTFIHDGAYAQDASAGDVPGANPTEPLLD